MSNITMRARLAWLSAVLGLFAVAAGLAGLAGRLFDLATLNAFLPSYLAAAAIVLCGGALAFAAAGSGTRTTRYGRVLAVSAIALCLATLLAFAFLSITQLHSVMMAPLSAVVALMLAVAIILVQQPRTVTSGQVLALTGLACSVIATIGYFEGLDILRSPFPIRLSVAMALGAIAIGILIVRPDQGPMRIVTSATLAGRVARSLMLPLSMLPILLSVAFYHMPDAAWRISPEWTNVLFTFSSILIIAGLVWWQVLTLYRSEQRDRRLQERTRQVQGQYELVVQAAIDYAIYTLDQAGFITSWNTGAERIRGYRAEEIIGRPYSTLFTEQDRRIGRPRQLLEQARRTGRVVSEDWVLRKDGSRFFGHGILTRMTDARGRLLGFTKITRDITAQKEAKDEQTKLQSILNTVIDPLVVIDGDGLIETFNPAAERVFGYQASEVMHRSIKLLMPSPMRDEHDAYLRRYRETGEARVIGIGREIEAQRKDGTVFPAELSVSEMLVEGRQMFTGIVRDISERKAAEEALQRSEKRLKLALEAGNIGVWDVAIDSRAVIATGPLFETLIVPEENNELSTWIGLNHPDDQAVMQQQFDEIANGDEDAMELEHRLRTREGDWHWLFTRATVSTYDEAGKPMNMHGVTVDIHHRKIAEEALRKSKLDMEMAIRDADFHLWHFDVAAQRVTDLHELLEALGYREVPETESVSFWKSLLHPDDREYWSGKSLLPLPEELRQDGVEIRLRANDGDWRWMVVRARVMEVDARGQPSVIAGTCIDITARKQAAQELLDAAKHDSLTGLPNRALTYSLGEHLLESAPRHGKRCAVLFVDLDRFKPINDQYGHATGDAILHAVAQRLKACVRTEDVVGRLGGDEFLIVLAHPGSVEDISKVGSKCLAEVSRPFILQEMEFQISSSIGISLFPADGDDMEVLVKHADVAMYHAKQNGRNRLQFFTQAMNRQVKSLLRIEGQMRRAIDREAFSLHYQPIIDTEHNKTTGVEALLRWPAANIGPEEFIPLAESSGMIMSLGDWVLQKACRQQVAWRAEGMRAMRVSVNVSPVQFRQYHFRERVRQIVEETGIDPACLQLEITETAFLQNPDQVVRTLNELRAMGLSIALDDFGKGYSSFNYLRSLPLDVVKVDKDFVHQLESDQVNRAITEAIIGLSERLGLQVIAEGIETEAVMRLLRDKRCRHMQGFFLSRPLEPGAFEIWCRDPLSQCQAWQH